MNDRIRELYLQAHSIRHYDGDPMREGNPPTVYWQGEKSAEKFAELIVRECLLKIEDERYELPDFIVDSVKQHFGVSE